MNGKTRMTLVTCTMAMLACGGAAFGQCGASKSACAGETETVATLSVMAGAHGRESAADIVDTATKAGTFKTLLAAAQAAGLVETLKGAGPLTVFAPTDEAFAKLPAGTVETLLKPANKEKLAAVLKYHVVAGTVAAKDVKRSSGVATLAGQRLAFTFDGQKVMVDNATVMTGDITCSNGVIHVIDRVMLPTTDNVVAVAQSAGTFNTLLAAARAAGLVDALSGAAGQITVFAPTDEAFAKLPAGTVEELLKPENKEALATVLKYHVVAGRVYAADAVKAGRATTLQGSDVVIDIVDGQVRVDGAKVTATDIDASNGVVHVIDRVILPM